MRSGADITPDTGTHYEQHSQHWPRRSRFDRDEGCFQDDRIHRLHADSRHAFIASALVDNGHDGQGFGASSVWLSATLLTIGYMISRGLAKSGSRENYDRDERDNRR